MANFVLDIPKVGRRGLPYWVDDEILKGHSFTVVDDTQVACTNGGLLINGDVRDRFISGYIPIASGLPVDNVDVLIQMQVLKRGTVNFYNTGGAIVLGPSRSNNLDDCYLGLLGSGSSRGVSIRKRVGLNNESDVLGTISVTALNGDDPFLFRLRRVGSSIKAKIWKVTEDEPTTWNRDGTDSTFAVTDVGFMMYSYSQIMILQRVAYATNGDTATFSRDVVDMVAGSVANAKAGDVVNIHEVSTHNIIKTIELTSSGSWQAELYNDKPVYARIERAGGSEYDLLFAKYGDAYLGGDYPNGALKDDGVPSAGEVSVLYRSNNPILGGVTIAKVSAAPSGEWRVSGLQPNVPFDVVARKPDRKDTVVSGVIGVPDPSFKFSLMGSASNAGDYLKGLFFAKGATPPVTAQFTGATPYGMDASAFAIDGNIVNVNTPMRDYGQFNFSIDISDGDGNTMSSPVVITDAKRAPFVDFIAAVNSKDRGNTTTPITAVIPSSVMPDDILVIGIMRRGEVLVSDDNSGIWTLGADSIDTTMYNQGTSIYYRTAKADDAGKTITVSGSFNGRLIVYLSVYRGKFAPLTVKSARSGPVRYDSTYSSGEKNLEPIPHSSGFLIRAVSNVYAIASNSGLMEISNMTPTGPAFGDPYRLQVAYAHLSESGTLISTYKTASSNADDVIPEVSIILDEVRP